MLKIKLIPLVFKILNFLKKKIPSFVGYLDNFSKVTEKRKDFSWNVQSELKSLVEKLTDF